MQSVMKHTFSQVPRAEIPRSKFDRSHGKKLTMDAGFLVPFYVDEILPGDSVNLKCTTFGRLNTPLVPLMDNMFVETFFFFVPNRLVWDNWQKFMGEQRNPGDSTSFVVPQVVSPAGTGWLTQSVYDYMGIPTNTPGLSVNALPLRAYNLIYNEWFRDQNLQNSVATNVGDGPDAQLDYQLLRRGKRHDYFTSALPFPQKGPSISIPLGTSAPVNLVSHTVSTNAMIVRNSGTGVSIPNQNVASVGSGFLAAPITNAVLDPNGRLVADLSTATAATINSLRQAFALQKLAERDARGGTRYTEILRAHFGVTSPDARLQRPEYLGGGSTQVNFTPVPQTSSTDATTPQANLAATATFSQSGQGFAKSFVEHGFVIGLLNCRADLNYQQGLNRMWSRSTKVDYYWPALSHIGEQAVLTKEIYAQGSADPVADASVFGYQERYAEYRYKPSEISGRFRSTYIQPLDMWHLAQVFSAAPTLNSTFIVDNPPVDRIVAVPTEPNFLVDVYNRQIHVRPLPVYGVPGFLDRF